MQVIGLSNSKIRFYTQNFKGNFASSDSLSNYTPYQTAPLNTAQAYASPQISQGYKELETFNVPHIGDGKLYELTNGHKVIIVPKTGPTVINTYVKAGYSNEQPNLRETSHLLEHLLGNTFFKTEDKEVQNTLSNLGATSNAGTSFIYTNYYTQAPITQKEDLENLIKSQSKVLTNTNFSDKDVEQEKDIVTQELESKDRFNSDSLLKFRLTLKNLFNLDDTNSISYPTSHQSIRDITKQDLLNYYDTFYTPNNMVTVLVGDVDTNTIKIFAKHFGKIQNTKSSINYPQLPTDNTITKTIRKDVRSHENKGHGTNCILSFIGPENNNSKEKLITAALEHAIDLKIDAYSEKEGEDLKFNSYLNEVSVNKKAPIVISIEGESHDGNTEDDLKAIYSILHDLNQNKISDKELNIIKAKMKSNASLLDEDGYILSSMLGESAISSQSLNEAKEIAIIDSFKPEDIQNIAKKYLDLNKASIIVVHPQEKMEAFDKIHLQQPTFTGHTDILEDKDLHEYILPNNVRVVIDSRPGITRSSIKLDFHSKKKLYNNPEEGLNLASSLDSKETKQNLEDEGIYATFDGNSQQIFAKLNGNSEYTEKMLKYAISTLLAPDINAVKIYQRKLEAEDNEEPPKETMFEKIDKELLNETPYRYTRGNIKSLSVGNVKLLHQEILSNAQCTAFITLPPEDLEKNKPEIFKMLMKIPPMQPFDNKAINEKVEAVPLKKVKIFAEAKDSNQIEINKIFKIIETGNINDTAGLLVLNIVLGGCENSKLFQHLRNEDRISYSASSTFDLFPTVGNISELELSTKVSADKDKNNLKTVIQDFDKSIDEVTSKPITQTELKNAKAILKGNILNELETSENRNNFISKGYNTSYGINYQTALLEALDKVTVEQVQKLAQYYLTQPYLIAISGNKDSIESNRDYLSKFGEIIEC